MTPEKVKNYILQRSKFLITTHEAPDGDGLGAEYALYSILKDAGKDVIILNSDPLPNKYRFLNPGNIINNYVNESTLPSDISERSLIILDTEPNNTGHLSSYFINNTRDMFVIDHHSPKNDMEYSGWLDESASSTSEMIFRILEAFGHKIKKDIAVALYAGIVYDTGSFIYPKTSAETFRIAQKLVTAGAVPNLIYTYLYESKSKGALMLHSLVNSTMMLYNEDKIAVQIMAVETLIASGADYSESQEIVNFPLQCAKVRVSVFFKENIDGMKRCSIRSKGEVDCAEIAHRHGGGGHKTAAGFGFNKTFEEIQNEVLEEIAKYFS